MNDRLHLTGNQCDETDPAAVVPNFAFATVLIRRSTRSRLQAALTKDSNVFKDNCLCGFDANLHTKISCAQPLTCTLAWLAVLGFTSRHASRSSGVP